MKKTIQKIIASVLSLLFISLLSAPVSVVGQTRKNQSRAVSATGNFYNIRTFGAKGDGRTLDTNAINKAIETASKNGGGTVFFPAGTYLSFSIHLKSNITLYLDNGATILAADPAVHKGKYDIFEPNEFDMYQDFGHSHWKNSLMWGIGIENFAIVGQGRIDGHGLSRRSPGPRRPRSVGETPTSMAHNVSPLGETSSRSEMDGLGTKAIALKLSKN